MNIRNIYLIIIILSGLSVTSCKDKVGKSRIVSVSILPQKYFIEKIAGSFLEVNVMIPPGMSPATCDLNTEQLKKLHDSDICFTIGHLPFEQTHLYPVLEHHKEIVKVNHSEGISLIQGSCNHGHQHHHKHGGHDPHIWLSPRHALSMAGKILETLSATYPEEAGNFQKNHALLAEEIKAVDRKAGEVISRKKEKSFLIYHPALTYLAADYGMEQISIEDEGKEPNPTHLKAIIDEARQKRISLVFIQSQFDMNNARSVAKEIGAQVIQIDPLNGNWSEEMNALIGILDRNLADK